MPEYENFLKWAARQRRPLNAETREAFVAASRGSQKPAPSTKPQPPARNATADVKAFLESIKGAVAASAPSAPSRPSEPAEPRRRPTSAVAMARPGGAGQLLDWATETGRIDASTRHAWEAQLIADPELTDQQLRDLPSRAWATKGGYDKPAPARLLPQRAVAAGVSQAEVGEALWSNIPPPAGQRPDPFAAGALPRTTASGADPKLLGHIDMGDEKRTAAARINASAAPTAAAFHDLYERYTGPYRDAEIIQLDQPGASEAWADYEARVTDWASTPDLGS